MDTGHPRDRTVTAVLGPTNTGKTHYAIERMLGHRTGVIGLPLRLLAREVYDRIVRLRGPSVVALVTGEERIVPARTQYWVCTVEAMPLEIGADFVAVDEIQLCADGERGHVFTDRLLNARGLHETLFLGAETMRPRIAALIPGVQTVRRDRFSTLTWAGSKKLSRLPERSAIVGFSVDEVYAIAELLRRQKGGAAVVMGALSPRTRNAQVELYQNGDVDYLVATDAIGMGVNLDVRHVAFAGTTKFDGHRHRRLTPNELAQIAGRAGRHTDDGTFGVTGDAGPLDEDVIDAIENHRFAPIQRLQYRNSRLEFGSVAALIGSLEAPPPHPDLARAREADDLSTLRALWADPDVQARAATPAGVRRLWDVCQVPDFRKTSPAEHTHLLGRIYQFLSEGAGCISSDWLAGQVARIDRTEGDIDALSRRLAYIRTWTYVAQRHGWVEAEENWRGETRAVEDRLSDALHARLTQRFVDRRTSVLMRRLKERENLVADVSDTGDVTVEGHFIGRLEGFQFRFDPSASADETRTLRSASLSALQTEFNRRADRFYNAPDPEIGLTEQGGLMWGEHAVGRLLPGPDIMTPEVRAFVDENADPAVGERVARRLTHWINRRIAAQFEPLIALRGDEAVTGLARGIAFRLVEQLGVIPRDEIAGDVKALDQEARGMLRKHGVRFGQYTVFQQAVLKPGPTQLRLILWSLFTGLDEFPSAPPPGLVTIPAVLGAPPGYYPRAGYHLAGTRAIRIDMLERLADQIRLRDTRGGFEAAPEMLSITGLTLEQFADMMQGLGYRAERGERAKQKLRPAPREDAAPAAVSSLPADGPVTGAGVEGRSDPEAPGAGVAATQDAADEVVAAGVVASESADGVPGGTADAAPVEIAAGEPTPAEPAATSISVEDREPAWPAASDSAEMGSLPPAIPDAEHDPVPVTGMTDQGGAVAEASETPVDGAAPEGPVEVEVFYTFAWVPKRREAGRPRPQGERPERGPRRDGTRAPAAREAAPVTVTDAASADPVVAPPPSPAPEARVEGRRDERTRGPRTPEGDRGPRRDDRPEGGGPRRPPHGGNRPERDGEGGRGKGRDGERANRGGGGEEKPRVYTARPPREDQTIDPDNPFAALLALKKKD